LDQLSIGHKLSLFASHYLCDANACAQDSKTDASYHKIVAALSRR